jgi:hypothetical protein
MNVTKDGHTSIYRGSQAIDGGPEKTRALRIAFRGDAIFRDENGFPGGGVHVADGPLEGCRIVFVTGLSQLHPSRRIARSQ